jgi:hypothetical protein
VNVVLTYSVPVIKIYVSHLLVVLGVIKMDYSAADGTRRMMMTLDGLTLYALLLGLIDLVDRLVPRGV